MVLPDPFPAFNSSQDDIQEITPERNPEKFLEPEKEKLRIPEKVVEPEAESSARVRLMCLRSSAPGWPRRKKGRKKGTRKRKVRTQDRIEEGLRYLDESDLESIEDGCLLLGLTRDVIDLD